MNSQYDQSGQLRIDSVGGVTIAVEGCCHGELDAIYAEIAAREQQLACKVELLLICGDFQCVRDNIDLQCLAVPHKYRRLNTFQQYVAGENVAPLLTVFIGGNHEASNILQSLYYGGFVAPNIYFLGFAGVVRFKNLRIAGVSGIFNEKNYRMGHFECPPYSESTLRSVYHLRELEVYRLMHLATTTSSPIDIFLSHDWPLGIWDYGNKQQLLRVKPYFRDDMLSGKLGSPPLMHLLRALKPRYWFAAHLHVKFQAMVPHASPPLPPVNELQTCATKASDSAAIDLEEVDADDRDSQVDVPCSSPARDSMQKQTHFLALDKVIPKRNFLEVLRIDSVKSVGTESDGDDCFLKFDFEWLAIIHKTHQLLSTRQHRVAMPAEVHPCTAKEIDAVRTAILSAYGSDRIPNIVAAQPQFLSMPCTDTHYNSTSINKYARGEDGRRHRKNEAKAMACFNPSHTASVLSFASTDQLLNALSLQHIWTKPLNSDVKHKEDIDIESKTAQQQGLRPSIVPHAAIGAPLDVSDPYGLRAQYSQEISNQRDIGTKQKQDDPNSLDI